MGTRRWLLFMCAWCLTFGSLVVDASAAAPDSDPPEAPTTTVQVASGAPVPQAPAPRIGPFIGSASGSGIRAAWWLLVLGVAQVMVLMYLVVRSWSRVPARRDGT